MIDPENDENPALDMTAMFGGDDPFAVGAPANAVCLGGKCHLQILNRVEFPRKGGGWPDNLLVPIRVANPFSALADHRFPSSLSDNSDYYVLTQETSPCGHAIYRPEASYATAEDREWEIEEWCYAILGGGRPGQTWTREQIDEALASPHKWGIIFQAHEMSAPALTEHVRKAGFGEVPASVTLTFDEAQFLNTEQIRALFGFGGPYEGEKGVKLQEWMEWMAEGDDIPEGSDLDEQERED